MGLAKPWRSRSLRTVYMGLPSPFRLVPLSNNLEVRVTFRNDILADPDRGGSLAVWENHTDESQYRAFPLSLRWLPHLALHHTLSTTPTTSFTASDLSRHCSIRFATISSGTLSVTCSKATKPGDSTSRPPRAYPFSAYTPLLLVSLPRSLAIYPSSSKLLPRSSSPPARWICRNERHSYTTSDTRFTRPYWSMSSFPLCLPRWHQFKAGSTCFCKLWTAKADRQGKGPKR
jgi:hypothetical protein